MAGIIALISATAVLVLIPGPNAALIVATSIRRGLGLGLVTVAGTTAGIAVQLLMVVAGLAALIDAAASALAWIKWLGAAYLVWLGIRTWRAPASTTDDTGLASRTGAFWRGAMLALTNPKTLLFNAAFLPQFVGDGTAAGSQLLVLGAVYLAVIAIGDSAWALSATTARHWLNRCGRLGNRMTGGVLVGAGVGLALAGPDR